MTIQGDKLVLTCDGCGDQFFPPPDSWAGRLPSKRALLSSASCAGWRRGVWGHRKKDECPACRGNVLCSQGHLHSGTGVPRRVSLATVLLPLSPTEEEVSVLAVFLKARRSGKTMEEVQAEEDASDDSEFDSDRHDRLGEMEAKAHGELLRGIQALSDRVKSLETRLERTVVNVQDFMITTSKEVTQMKDWAADPGRNTDDLANRISEVEVRLNKVFVVPVKGTNKKTQRRKKS